MALELRFVLLFLALLNCASYLCFASPLVSTNTTTGLKIAFIKDVSSFFLEHYSNTCATSVIFNNTCPGSDHGWHAPENYLQLKELCSAFATYNACLQKSICLACSNGTSTVNAYCAKMQNDSSALPVCKPFSFSGLLSNQQQLLSTFAFSNFAWFFTAITILSICIIATLYLLIFK